MENKKLYTKKCPICGKVIQTLSENQCIWNYKIHYHSCEEKIKKEETKNEANNE